MGRLGIWLSALSGAAWYFGLAAAFLITWVSPYTFGETTVHKFTFMMMLEFLVVHSTGFFGGVVIFARSKWKRALLFLGLIAVYSLFAWGFSVAYGGPWPFYAFLLLTAPQFQGIVFKPLRKNEELVLGLNWSGMVALYLLGVFATLILDIPPLGITTEVIEAQGFQTGGMWMEEPYRVAAFGVIYFTGRAFLFMFIEVFGGRVAGENAAVS